MSEILAYVAGIIDGEGYIGLIPSSSKQLKNPSYSPKVKVTNTNEEMVIFLYKTFGGHLDKLRFLNNPVFKPARMWTLSNKVNVKPFLISLIPYLKIKKKQAELVINYCNNYSYKEMRQKDNKKALQKRNDYYHELRKLNHRGNTPATTE